MLRGSLFPIVLGLIAIISVCPGSTKPALEKRQEICNNLEFLTTVNGKEFFYAPKCAPTSEYKGWSGAILYCYNNGMSLAQPENLAEVQQLNSAIQSNPSLNGYIFWTGARVAWQNQDKAVLPEGAWSWLSDENATVDSSVWSKGEPNRLSWPIPEYDYTLYENCGEFTPYTNSDGAYTYGINDGFCEQNHIPMCERRVETMTVNPATAMPYWTGPEGTVGTVAAPLPAGSWVPSAPAAPQGCAPAPMACATPCGQQGLNAMFMIGQF